MSPGCKHCYAETFSERFRGVPGHPFEDDVNSMSDLFHERVPDAYIEAVATVMALANWHTYQVLTKRAERMATMLAGSLRLHGTLEHIWWGVSVEEGG